MISWVSPRGRSDADALLVLLVGPFAASVAFQNSG